MGETQGGTPMAKPRGLRKRGGSWEMRVRVPKELKSILPTEIVKTLGGVSTKEAYLLAEIERAKIALRFEDARRRLGIEGKDCPKPDKLTDDRIDDAAKQFLRMLEANAPPIPLNDDDQADFMECVDDDVSNLAHPDAAEDANVQREARAFARRIGVTLGGADDFRFFEAVREAWLEHAARQSARVRGATVATINPAFAGVTGDASEQSATIAEAIEEYISAAERSANSASTRKMDRSRLGAFAKLVGPDRSIASLTRSDMRKYADDLRNLPAHCEQRFPGKTFAEAISLAKAQGRPTLSPASIKRDIQATKSFFRWLEKQELIRENPARFLDPPKAPKKSDRRPFRRAELRALLNATGPDISGEKTWAYWVVRLAALQGFRLTEPLGLKVGDLRRSEDGWIIQLRPNEYRSLKNEETARTVPLHPRLIELGILDLCKDRDPDALLISDTPRSKGRAFNAAQKKMGRIIRRDVTADPNAVFHSLRHGFIDALRNVGCPTSVEERLGGWKLSNNVMSKYGSGHRMGDLRGWIAKVGYDDVTID